MASAEEQKNPPLFSYLCRPASVLGLVLLGELLAFALVLADSPTSLWASFGELSLVVQWMVLSSAMLLCRCHGLLNRLSAVASGSLAFGLCLLVAAAVLFAVQWLQFQGFDWGQWFRSLVIAAIFSGILLRYLYLQQQLINRKQAELQARVESLQARIRPHFLFNSLNTIASLIPTDPNLAERTLEDLSELFRASLQAPGLVPLEDEIHLCQRYMAIEERRLAERLRVEWDCPTPLPSIDIPSLLLQPLLENAICHGIQPLAQGGLIRVQVAELDEQVSIQVENPIANSAAEGADKGNHMALENIRHRLQLYFGEGSQLELSTNDENYRVEIHVPKTVLKAVPK